MKEFVNKHLTAIIAAVFAIIVVIVLAVVFIGGDDKEKNPNTELGTESTETIGGVEDTEEVETPSTELPSTEVVTPETPSTEDTTPDTPSSEDAQPEKPAYTFTDLNKTMYAKSSVNVRDLPCTDGNKIGSLARAQEVKVTGQCNETKWYRIELNGGVAYVSNSYLVDEKPADETPSTPDNGNVENGDTNIQEDNGTVTVNNYTIETGAAYEHNKRMAEAGLYTPVWNSATSEYFMLIKASDDSWYWDGWLCDYITERGGTPGAGGGNYAGVSLDGELLYQIYVFVVQQ